ncbi:MAG: hypothetical protein K2P93_08130 [Alphaproteobacteria bacterium]|nr:hypothetical protein [Alphaproteobacteria bacterium]
MSPKTQRCLLGLCVMVSSERRSSDSQEWPKANPVAHHGVTRSTLDRQERVALLTPLTYERSELSFLF